VRSGVDVVLKPLFKLSRRIVISNNHSWLFEEAELNSLIQPPYSYPITNDNEALSPCSLHECPKLFDRAIIPRSEIQHCLYIIQR
jgi:hypothetical protein